MKNMEAIAARMPLVGLVLVLCLYSVYFSSLVSVDTHSVRTVSVSMDPHDERVHVLASFPLCEYEDGVDCQWKADAEGNGIGDSFVSIAEGPVQRVFYSDGHVESFPNGYYCDPLNDQDGDSTYGCPQVD